MEPKNKNILDFIIANQPVSSKEIYDGRAIKIGYATVKRILSNLVKQNLVATTGQGRARKYLISSAYNLLYPIDLNSYFEKEIDDREILGNYNLNLIKNTLKHVALFTQKELQKLQELQKKYEENILNLSETAYNNELERLAIDLSWKSSQIEGNTYSLLETERLLKEKETASGKSKDEAVMLLNHKDAIDFIVNDKSYVTPITIPRIEDIHSLLIKDLGIERNIRKRRVGISGTNYKPLDNEYQIKEALIDMCELVDSKEIVFEKALLALVLLSYIQAFGDGNKRTARIISNAILISNGYCPISFRTIDAIEYKKAMLLFYEQNNITAFKNIFINQFEFAVNTYF